MCGGKRVVGSVVDGIGVGASRFVGGDFIVVVAAAGAAFAFVVGGKPISGSLYGRIRGLSSM